MRDPFVASQPSAEQRPRPHIRQMETKNGRIIIRRRRGTISKRPAISRQKDITRCIQESIRRSIVFCFMSATCDDGGREDSLMPFLFRHATTSERKKKNHDQIKLKKKEGRTLSTEDNSSSFVTAGPGACVEKTRGMMGSHASAYLIEPVAVVKFNTTWRTDRTLCWAAHAKSCRREKWGKRRSNSFFSPLLISYVTLRRENREFFPFNC